MNLKSSVATLLGRNKTLFQALELEISSPCNLKCETCPNTHHRRPRHELPIDIIEQVSIQLGQLGYTGAFSPHFYNEPLLDKRLVDILTLFRKNAPQVTINLFTNFTLMTPTLYRQLLPLVDEFIVTSDEPAVAQAIAEVTQNLTEDELIKLRTRSLKETGLSNRAGAMEIDCAAPQRATQCALVNTMVVDAWGDVHLCCNDYFGEAIYGNINDSSLKKIWFSDEYVRARQAGAKGSHPLCSKCYWTE